MNKKIITIVDYECGNIYSLLRILDKFGYKVELTNNPDKIKNADKVILPGVGSFKTGIDNLKKNNLDDAINFFFKERKLYIRYLSRNAIINGKKL